MSPEDCSTGAHGKAAIIAAGEGRRTRAGRNLDSSSNMRRVDALREEIESGDVRPALKGTFVRGARAASSA